MDSHYTLPDYRTQPVTYIYIILLHSSSFGNCSRFEPSFHSTSNVNILVGFYTTYLCICFFHVHISCDFYGLLLNGSSLSAKSCCTMYYGISKIHSYFL